MTQDTKQQLLQMAWRLRLVALNLPSSWFMSPDIKLRMENYHALYAVVTKHLFNEPLAKREASLAALCAA